MKITLILVAAPKDPLRENDPFMPLSLPLLAGAAPDHEYTFVDMLAGEEPDYEAPTDLVGLSVRLTAEKTAFRIAERYRQRGVKVVAGGPQISSVPRRAAEQVDAVAVGEGEVLWPIIVKDAARGALSKFYVASPVPFETGGAGLRQVTSYADLAKIPFPERRYYRRKYVFDTVFAARGCAIDCDFCSVPHLFGKPTRLRPVEQVVQEIGTLGDFFYLLDDTVFGRPATYDYYLELYQAIGRLPKKRFWTGQANLDAAADPKGREVIQHAARAGLTVAAVGLESIRADIQQKSGTIRKSGARDAADLLTRMKEGIHVIQEEGILITGWFTMGYEEHTRQDFYDTMEFCRQMHVVPVLCPLEALPGTRLHARLSAEGRVNTDRKVNITHPTLSDDEILALLDEANDRGFTMREILRRTAYFVRRCHRSESALRGKIENVMKKGAFAFQMQRHMRKGLVGLANQH